jgi:hypothetical protein
MQKLVICAKDSGLNDIFCSHLIGISRADGQCVCEASQKLGSRTMWKRLYIQCHPIIYHVRAPRETSDNSTFGNSDKLRICLVGDEKKRDATPIGRPIAADHAAASTSQTEPGFIARPPGARVYHGFQVLTDVVVDGFIFGKITDFEAERCDYGDAFVIAPDNSRAGLIWEVSDRRFFERICPSDEDRWGVWSVSFPLPMTTRDNVRKNLESVLPELKQRWEEWRQN